jgi:hypothetical protein
MTVRSAIALVVLVLGAAANLACGHDAAASGSNDGRGGGRADGPNEASAIAVDALPGRASFAVRVAFSRLRGTPIADSLPSLVRETPLAERYDRWVRACRRAPVETFDDAVVGLGDGALLFAAELRVPAEEALRCVRESFGGHEVMFQDRQALRIDGPVPLFVLTTGRLLLVGDEASVAESLDMGGRSRPLAACLDADPSSIVSGCGALPALGARELRFRGRSTPAALSVDATAEFDDAAGARALGARFAALEKAAAHEETFVRNALVSVRVEPSGARAKVTFGTTGDGVLQSGYLIALATGLHHVLWAEEAKALAGEARANVAAIAEALRKAAGKPRARGPVFPVAPPAVPAEVPRGVVHQPVEGEFSHPTWAELGFVLREPYRYRYEIVVRRDRRRASVLAYGDLDGNGRTSRFEIVLEAKGSSIAVSPMTISDELE